MEKIIQCLSELRTTCGDLQDRFTNQTKWDSRAQPIGAFGMCSNYATQSLELHLYYATVFQNTSDARLQNDERILMLQTSLLVQILSAVEFGTKEAVKFIPNSFRNIDGRLYLTKILKNSRELFDITDDDYIRWQSAIELRNCIVHNNAISEKKILQSYPDFDLTFVVGKMIKTDLLTLPKLCKWIVTAFGKWVDKYLSLLESSTSQK